MPNPIIRIHDTETNEIIDREMTDEEFKAHKAEMQIRANEAAALEAKQMAKAAVLEKLGLTDEEAALLLK